MTTNTDITFNDLAATDERPWWTVRRGLLATLALLVIVLTAVLSNPHSVERTLRLAGL